MVRTQLSPTSVLLALGFMVMENLGKHGNYSSALRTENRNETNHVKTAT